MVLLKRDDMSLVYDRLKNLFECKGYSCSRGVVSGFFTG